MYKIVTSSDFDLIKCQELLEKKVNDLLNWTPQGGISVMKSSGGLYTMFQAMIRKT